MSASKKRKSMGSPVVQPTISKFFKSSAVKKSPKVPVIHVIDDDCKNDENANEKRKVTNASKLGAKVKHSLAKLKEFELDIEVEKGQKKPLMEENGDIYVNKKKNLPLERPKSFEKSCHQNEKLKEKIEVQSIVNPDFQNFTKLDPLKKYTPLEKQVIEVKKNHEDIVLFIQCGYKYRFFGHDAEIASKELNIYCHLDHNFMTASIPVHRLNVHVERLIEKGYKVGVVEQIETAALKAAGDNKNAPFVRKLTKLYTRATFIDKEGDNSSGHHIIAVTTIESVKKLNAINIVAVNPLTGDITYDIIGENNLSRLHTFFLIHSPTEIILPYEKMSTAIEKFVQNYLHFNKLTRIERLKVSHKKDELSENIKLKLNSEGLYESVNLLYEYLVQFKLTNILQCAENYHPYTELKQWMRLDSSSILNFELFSNNTNGNLKGSIFWILNHTRTTFGKRLLRKWLGKPLVNIDAINQRLDAVDDLIIHLDAKYVKDIINRFYFLPDLERGVTCIHHRKVTPQQFIKVLESLENLNVVFKSFENIANETFQSSLLKTIYSKIPNILGNKISSFLENLNKQEIDNGNKTDLFKDMDEYPSLKEIYQEIDHVKNELEKHMNKEIRVVLNDKSVEYKTVSGLEYLVEVKNTKSKIIPNDWIKISSTKQVGRYRSLFVDKWFKKLCQLREQLIIESNKCWETFLDDFSLIYPQVLQAVELIASFDCLSSLSVTSKQSGYCKPSFTKMKNVIDIKDGRHPVIHTLLGEDNQYVANDTMLEDSNKAMLISGPNMGGKSSYIKQVGIICILAQIGCYVPASSATLSVVDGIYTRMGASDNIWQGKSTLLVELEEASVIMREATANSLVIMDELGRGTSTYDGAAIAYATLKYLIEEVKSFTLFVTHHPILSEFESLYKGLICNYHMGYITSNVIGGSLDTIEKDSSMPKEEETTTTDSQETDVIFLYKITPGPAGKSYGLNVAKLAKLNESIILGAAEKSKELELKCSRHKKVLDSFISIFCEKDKSKVSNMLQQLVS